LGLRAATVLLPVALESRVAPCLGLVWQGRYTMPIAVGVPLIAAYALTQLPEPADDARVRTPADMLITRLCATVVAVLAIAHVTAFLSALRRYTVGAGLTHKLDLFSGPWQPPLTAAGVSVLFGLAILGYGWWLLRLAGPGREPQLVSAHRYVTASAAPSTSSRPAPR